MKIVSVWLSVTSVVGATASLRDGYTNMMSSLEAMVRVHIINHFLNPEKVS